MKLNAKDVIARMTQARQLLDEIYYWAEKSDNDNLIEVTRLMSWSDSCIMDAEIEITKYFGE